MMYGYKGKDKTIQKSTSNKKEISETALIEFKLLFKLNKKEFKLTKTFLKNSIPVIFSFLLINKINQILGKNDISSYNLSILKDLLLGKIIYTAFTDFYKNDYDAEKYYLALKVLLSNSTWCEEAKTDSAKSILGSC